MRHCDTLLIIGSNMPYSEYYPEPGQARGVQIDIDGAQCGLKYATEVNLTGDAGATLEALLPLLEQHDDDWRTEIARHKQRWDDYSASGPRPRRTRSTPRPSCAASRPACPPTPSVAVDCGTATSWYARDLDLGPGHLGSLAGPAAVDGRRDAVRDRGQDGQPRPARCWR